MIAAPEAKARLTLAAVIPCECWPSMRAVCGKPSVATLCHRLVRDTRRACCACAEWRQRTYPGVYAIWD